MKTAVIYHTKTGFTERYAKWLQEDLGCDLVPFSQRDKINLSSYDAVVFGAGCHAGRIRKLKWFQEQLPRLAGKRLAVFFTGAMPPEPAVLKQTEEQNFSAEQREQIGIFYLWAGLNYEKMGAVDRAMMGMFRKMLQAKADPTEVEREMAKALKSSYDQTDRKYLEPLEEYLKN